MALVGRIGGRFAVRAHFSSPRYFTSTVATSHSADNARGSFASRANTNDKRWGSWTPVIGLELHVQLKGNVKLFSRASHLRTTSRTGAISLTPCVTSAALAAYEAIPNSNVAVMDAALPGTLPVRSLLVLSCRERPLLTFSRRRLYLKKQST
jgi:aspartyl-tRNA(Asn)/glutamyl-tRNA(Gln) amidotransferase subunit B